MRFDTDNSTPKLYFKPIRALSETELAMVARLQKDPEVEELIRMNYKPNEPQQESAGSLFDGSEPQQVAQTKKKPAPVVEEEVDEEEDDEPAPVVKPKAKAQPAAAPQVPNLTDLMGEWDD
jgi:hypothetical protein